MLGAFRQMPWTDEQSYLLDSCRPSTKTGISYLHTCDNTALRTPVLLWSRPVHLYRGAYLSLCICLDGCSIHLPFHLLIWRPFMSMSAFIWTFWVAICFYSFMNLLAYVLACHLPRFVSLNALALLFHVFCNWEVSWLSSSSLSRWESDLFTMYVPSFWLLDTHSFCCIYMHTKFGRLSEYFLFRCSVFFSSFVKWSWYYIDSCYSWTSMFIISTACYVVQNWQIDLSSHLIQPSNTPAIALALTGSSTSISHLSSMMRSVSTTLRNVDAAPRSCRNRTMLRSAWRPCSRIV